MNCTKKCNKTHEGTYIHIYIYILSIADEELDPFHDRLNSSVNHFNLTTL